MIIDTFQNNSQTGTSAANNENSTAAISGFDVSCAQKDINFLKAKKAENTFVFIHATDGITYQDPTYKQNILNARAAGLVVGSYHFYRTNDDPQLQFENFSEHANVCSGDLPPVIDIEEWTPDNQINADLIAELTQFINAIQKKYGVAPIIYSGESFANSYLSELGEYPLWLAEYNNDVAPKVPSGWSQWTFWQYSNSGKIDGISNYVDLDRFNGDTQSFSSLLIKQLQE